MPNPHQDKELENLWDILDKLKEASARLMDCFETEGLVADVTLWKTVLYCIERDLWEAAVYTAKCIHDDALRHEALARIKVSWKSANGNRYTMIGEKP